MLQKRARGRPQASWEFILASVERIEPDAGYRQPAVVGHEMLRDEIGLYEVYKAKSERDDFAIPDVAESARHSRRGSGHHVR